MKTDEMSKTLVGSWSAVVTAINQDITFPGLLSFTSDGIVLANEPPGPFESTAHGNWISTGPTDVAYTFLYLEGGPDNRFSGKGKVIGSLHYDAKADDWKGPFKIWGMDAEGNQTSTDNGTVTCKRIVVEMLD